MFKNIVAKIRGVLHKMGLISGVKKIIDKPDVIMSESMYDHIQRWKAVYQGYLKDWHDVTYMTIAGEKKRVRNTMGMGKVISAKMANLVFNENCSFSINDNEFSENIIDVLDRNAFTENFQDHLERMFALGGGAIEGYADENGIRLDFVAADAFIPIADNGRIVTEGIFVRESRKGKKKYTLLRWHTWENTEVGKVYVIKNELYESDNDYELGIQVNLAKVYPELEEEVRMTNLNRPLFVYSKPNTANNIDLSSKLGISVYANAMDTMQALDIAFDSFEREFRLGKKRIAVPQSAIKTVVDPQTGAIKRYFDVNDEVYQAFNMEEGSEAIKDVSMELRVDEHISAINALLNILAMQTGFSPGAFTFDSQGLKTATEVVSENSETFRTRAGHIKLIEQSMIDLVEMIGQIAELYGFFAVPEEVEVAVNFDDSIAEDRTTNAAYWTMLVGAGIGVPKYMALMKILKVTKEEALELIAESNEESRMVQPESVDLLTMASAPSQVGQVAAPQTGGEGEA